MTEQEQRIAIAEACGWHVISTMDGQFKQLASPVGMLSHCCGNHLTDEEVWISCFEPWLQPDNVLTPLQVPNYLNDLNAMHEAENTLSEYDKVNIYDSELMCVCQNHFGNTIRATASQRAEAFLRTVDYLTSKRSQAI